MNFEYIIRSIIKKYFQSGKADQLKDKGLEEIKQAVKQNGGLWKDYKSQIYTLTKGVEKELGESFVKERTNETGTNVKQKLNQHITLFENKLEARQKEIFNTIQKSIAKSITENKDWKTIARESLRKINLEEHHINTEIETTKAALNNLTRFEQFQNAGITKLRYEGPKSERNFCKEHLGKVYLVAEIANMLNDFSQPAYSFAGGYNCRHRWVPVTDENSLANLDFGGQSAPMQGNQAINNLNSINELKEFMVNELKNNLHLDIKDNVVVDNSLSLEQFKKMAKQLSELSNEYELAPGASSPIKLEFQSIPGAFGQVTFIMDRDLVNINFGHKYIDRRNKNAVRLDVDIGRPKSLVDKDNLEISTLTHEFGHVIGDSQRRQDTKSTTFWAGIRSIKSQYIRKYNKLKSEGKLEDAGKIYLGDYAHNNPNISEFMAEGFTEYKLNSTPSPFAVAIGKLIDEYYKKGK